MIDFQLMDSNSIDTTKAKCFEGLSIGFIYVVMALKLWKWKGKGHHFVLLRWLLEHKTPT